MKFNSKDSSSFDLIKNYPKLSILEPAFKKYDFTGFEELNLIRICKLGTFESIKNYKKLIKELPMENSFELENKSPYKNSIILSEKNNFISVSNPRFEINESADSKLKFLNGKKTQFSTHLCEMQNDYNSKLKISIYFGEKVLKKANKNKKIDQNILCSFHKTNLYLNSNVKTYLQVLNQNFLTNKILSNIFSKLEIFLQIAKNASRQFEQIEFSDFQKLFNEFNSKCVFQKLITKI